MNTKIYPIFLLLLLTPMATKCPSAPYGAFNPDPALIYSDPQFYLNDETDTDPYLQMSRILRSSELVHKKAKEVTKTFKKRRFRLFSILFGSYLFVMYHLIRGTIYFRNNGFWPSWTHKIFNLLKRKTDTNTPAGAFDQAYGFTKQHIIPISCGVFGLFLLSESLSGQEEIEAAEETMRNLKKHVAILKKRVSYSRAKGQLQSK